MTRFAGALARLSKLLHPRAADERVNEEFRFHLEMETARNARLGMTPDEARRRAMIAFGGLDRHREQMREGRRLGIIEDLGRDLRYAARSLRRTPGFAAAAVLTLALGIAATTTMFTVLNAVLLRPLPVHDPERLASFAEVQQSGRVAGSVSLPSYLDYRTASSGTFVGLAAHHLSDVTLSTAAGAEVAMGMEVSGNYFSVLGVAPAAGSFFAGDRVERVGAEPVAVISHDLWRRRYAADPAIVGQVIRVNGQPLTIAGVAPSGFHGAMLGARPAVWLPIGIAGLLEPGRDITRRGMIWLQLFGRLRPGVTYQSAEAAMSVAARQLAARPGVIEDFMRDLAPVGVRVERFTTVPAHGRRGLEGFLLVLFVTGALVLLIAAVNVAGMLLARGTARRREMAIRLAMGAARRRLVRQLLTESFLLSLIGGATGVLLTLWATRWLADVRPPFAASFHLDMPLDVRVLGFALAVSLLTGILFGLTPALAAAHHDLVSALKDGALGTTRRARLRGAMVIGQLALSLILLVVAGLFTRTLQNALRVRHAFDPDGVIAFQINLRLNGYDEARGRIFYEQLLERARSVHGVESASLATVIPLGVSWDQSRLRVAGHEPLEGESGFEVGYNLVSPGYLATVKMPLLAGRDFTPADASREPRPLLVNETLARRFWPGRSPVGELVHFSGAAAEIVGVVPDGKYRSLSEEPLLFAYVPYGSMYEPSVWLHARVLDDRATTIGAIRREIAALDPHVPPVMITTMESVMGSALFPQRIAAGLVGTFGAIGLFLAAIGLFGLLSFTVAERSREIGVRIALGASRGQVVALVVGQGCRLLAAGVAAGVVIALGTTRVLGGFLHGLSPTDPVTFVTIPLLLAAVALVAVYLPARRAAAVDPIATLRQG